MHTFLNFLIKAASIFFLVYVFYVPTSTLIKAIAIIIFLFVINFDYIKLGWEKFNQNR
ncbi:hypothetical protein LZ578_01360 [Jeotgalibaca sp. MA1X17-3]|uniref:hypothetical protein n=1 Tax=Jeotgalibaca sp. MA1X17-3 TaxID=2908211 RepID=UPI001F364FF8|nr:hypothetical protein [Jeotgalibaca sp. MA1X17-3]UJF15842.1 hypothetical protein LZ578_01360 [Jeotgalibaca sp. MA1X17-3]